MSFAFALLGWVARWELERTTILEQGRKAERTINLSIIQNDGFMHLGKSRRQGRKKDSVIKHFLFNCLMSLHWLSFFAYTGIMLHEYYLGFSTNSRCVSYEIIPQSLILK